MEVNTTDEYTTTDEPGHNEGVAKKPKTRDTGKGSRKKRGSHTGNTLDRESKWTSLGMPVAPVLYVERKFIACVVRYSSIGAYALHKP